MFVGVAAFAAWVVLNDLHGLIPMHGAALGITKFVGIAVVCHAVCRGASRWGSGIAKAT